MAERSAIPERLRAVVNHQVAITLEGGEAMIDAAVLAECAGAPNSSNTLPVKNEIAVALHHKAERLEIQRRILRQSEAPGLEGGHAGPENRLIAIDDFELRRLSGKL